MKKITTLAIALLSIVWLASCEKTVSDKTNTETNTGTISEETFQWETEVINIETEENIEADKTEEYDATSWESEPKPM